MTSVAGRDLDSVAWSAVRIMQGILAVVVAYAAVTRQFGLVINSGIPLAITFLPRALNREYGYEMGGGLALWISGAAFLHAIGALGPYTMFGWYDQVTHTLSATLVAGAGYAIVVAIETEHDGVEIPSRLRGVFILLFVLAFGVLWEIGEFGTGLIAELYGGQAVLAQYGASDIALDLLFNAVGATIVALWGTGYFDGLSGLLARRVDRAENEP
ncbi:hypothetical protein ACFQDG_03655 [Natronoarchaeum mannanilyticum]|uniref:Energy-coupling factor transport system substrate-specific component n=1 Tax=Natronoarchaeum mannanilyticum TaxID=926360 RepID=A0AAV3TDV8_9EURY